MLPLPFLWHLRRCVSWSFIGLCPLSVCRSGPLLLQLSLPFAAIAALPLVAWSAAIAALPVSDGVMSSSADDMNVIDSSTIFIGTTNDEGWAKYGFSDTGSDSAKKVARKKEVKVEEKAEDSDKKNPEEQEKDKEDELVDRMTVMDLRPVMDSTSSKSLPVDPSPSEVSAGCVDSKRAKWGRDKWGHQNAQFLTQFLQWRAFCLHSLSVDRGTFATLVGDCTPDVPDVRRCHPLGSPTP